MKKKLKIKLSILAGALGFATLLLRAALYLLATDSKGLLVQGHPLDILIWAVSAAAVVLTVVKVWPLDGSARYFHNFSASIPAAIGTFALAGGTAFTILSSRFSSLPLELLRTGCGLLVIPAMTWVGLCRWSGRRPAFLFHGVTCLYLMLYCVGQYQAWSSLPQIQNYFFCMAGSLLLTLFAYQQTAFDVGMGNRRAQLSTGLLAAFFCIAAIAGGDNPVLYLTGSIWALTNLCNPVPVPRRKRSSISKTPEDPAGNTE